MKQQCHFEQHGINYIDYKDTETLKKFVNSHGRLIARRRTGVCATHQRTLARAVKYARQMALIPYIME